MLSDYYHMNTVGAPNTIEETSEEKKTSKEYYLEKVHKYGLSRGESDEERVICEKTQVAQRVALAAPFTDTEPCTNDGKQCIEAVAERPV